MYSIEFKLDSVDITTNYDFCRQNLTEIQFIIGLFLMGA